jgi:hypothetical protein
MTFREASLETSAAPERVGRVWSDVNSWPEWNPDMKESRLDGPLQVGTRGMINTRSGGKHDVVVTQFEDGKSFEPESTALPMTRMAIRATVSPAAGGTRLTHGIRTARIARANRRTHDGQHDPEDVLQCARGARTSGGDHVVLLRGRVPGGCAANPGRHTAGAITARIVPALRKS